MLRVRCPQCAKILAFPDKQAGGFGRCPVCRQLLRLSETKEWKVLSGFDARQSAIEQGVMPPDSVNFAAVVLRPMQVPAPQSAPVRGAIQCHGCDARFPFQQNLRFDGLYGGELACPSCGDHISFMSTSGDDEHEKFLVVSPITSSRRQQMGMIRLWVDQVGEQMLHRHRSQIRQGLAITASKPGDKAKPDAGSQVAQQLAQLVRPNLLAVEPLVLSLEDDLVWEASVKRLARMGRAAAKPLIAALKSKNFEVRWRSAQALGEIGDPHAVESLALLLKDAKDVVREEAAVALGKIGDGRAVEHLRAALKDEDRLVRKAVAKALRRIEKNLATLFPDTIRLKPLGEDIDSTQRVRISEAKALEMERHAVRFHRKYNDGKLDEVIGELGPLVPVLAEESELRRILSNACLDRGAARHTAGDRPGALEDFEAAAEAYPQNWRALSNCATVYMEVNRWSEAVTALERAAIINPRLYTQLDALRERLGL